MMNVRKNGIWMVHVGRDRRGCYGVRGSLQEGKHRQSRYISFCISIATTPNWNTRIFILSFVRNPPAAFLPASLCAPAPTSHSQPQRILSILLLATNTVRATLRGISNRLCRVADARGRAGDCIAQSRSQGSDAVPDAFADCADGVTDGVGHAFSDVAEGVGHAFGDV
jgi:hypothetical protein